MRKCKVELSNIRSRLALLREEIAKAKNDVTDLRGRFITTLKSFKQVSQELKKLSRNCCPDAAIDELKQKIEELEWKLITTPSISIEEERQIVNAISRLEQKLKTLISQQLKYSNIAENYEKSQKELNALRELIDRKREHLNALLKELMKLKEDRDKIKNEIATLRDFIGNLKNKLNEIKTQLTSINNTIKEKKTQYQEILRELRRLKEENERKEQQKILKERKEHVINKMNRGERVTIYDLYLVYGMEDNAS
jgi:uncharacterized coiled-coil DUF342 family protein